MRLVYFQKCKIPWIYVTQAVIAVLLLIFIVIVTWRLVSVEKALTEERRARSSDMEKIRRLLKTPLNETSSVESKLYNVKLINNS